MAQQPPQLLPAVQGLLLSQECAVARGAAGQHLSFMAARREEEEDRQQLHVAVAFFLRRCSRLLCLARAGCAALLVPDLTCLANPDPTTTSTNHRHPPSTSPHVREAAEGDGPQCEAGCGLVPPQLSLGATLVTAALKGCQCVCVCVCVYLMGGRTFSCLDAVINRYKTEQILEGHTLGSPVCKVVSGEWLGLPIVPVKEVEQPEKIYATLNEIREKLGVTKFKGIQKQGWLYKKSKKNKKWKCLYFVLTDILYYYDNPKRTKPRGLIDLNCSYLYQVHDSFFERPNCFQLVERELPCLSTVTYLCSESQELTNDWMAVLRPLCVPQTAGQPKLQTLKFMKSLHLTIMQATQLPSKIVPSPYCLVSLNQVKVCRTRPKPGPDPVWDEEFTLDDVPSDIMFTITVYNHGKRSKDSEVAEVRLELNTLQNGEEVEEWYPLTGITPVGDWGAIRLRYRYFHDLIMPCEEYNSLKELLLDPSLEAVQALADVSHRDRNPLATSLLRIFRNECREHDLLQRLTEHEIEREHETSTLFRAASLTTTLLDLYMKATCTEFLTEAISDTIHRILETKQSCELNPNKMDNPMDACANAEFLLRVLDDITSSIFSSASACPMPLRYICGCLQRKVAEKWPQDRLVRTRVVSGFIFLRLICPAILNPRQFSLLLGPPHPTASRSLIMIAKCLQNLGNLVEFGGKEHYMEVVNPFILKNKERMISYLDQLSNVGERPEIEDVPVKSEPS